MLADAYYERRLIARVILLPYWEGSGPCSEFLALASAIANYCSRFGKLR